MSRQSPIEASEEDVIEIDFIILWLGKMCLCDFFFTVKYFLPYIYSLFFKNYFPSIFIGFMLSKFEGKGLL